MVRVLSMIVVLAVSGSSLAQRPPQAPPIDQRVADLERKVAKLEQKVKDLQTGVAAKPSSDVPAQAPPVGASACANGTCGASATASGSGVAFASGGEGVASGIWFPGKRVIARIRGR